MRDDQNGHLGVRSLGMEPMQGKQARRSLGPQGLHRDSHQGSPDSLDCFTPEKSDLISLKHCYFGHCYLQPKFKKLSGESLHDLSIKHMMCENGGHSEPCLYPSGLPHSHRSAQPGGPKYPNGPHAGERTCMRVCLCRSPKDPNTLN